MSALTDLFTALANKIRSKTGTATTYTPPQMVSSGIDDVYNAGVAAGTPTLTGDAAAGNVLSGKTFYNTSTTKQTGSMTNNGAVSQTLDCGDSYTVPAGYHNGSGTVTANSLASQTGVDSGKTAIDASHVHSGYQGWVNGSKVSGSYVAPTINGLTPSNSSPQQITRDTIYGANNDGYAISSYQDITPSNSYTTSTYINAGEIAKINIRGGWILGNVQDISPSSSGQYFDNGYAYLDSNGYAYSSKPTGGFDAGTTLWTNSSPTSTFAAQDVTLSQSFTNFDYIKINWRASKSDTTASHILATPTALQGSVATQNYDNVGIGTCYGAGTRVRWIRYSSNTKLSISAAYNVNASGNNNDWTIPTSIVGLKFTP